MSEALLPAYDDRTRFAFFLRTPLVAVVPLCFGFAAGVDTALDSTAPLNPIIALGLGGLAGGFVALVGALVFRLLFARSLLLGVASWLALSGAFAAWLLIRLAAFEKLNSSYARLALMIIGATGLMALVLTLVGVAVQPRPSHPRGWLFEQRRSWRILTIVASAVLAVGLLRVDRMQVLATYPVAAIAVRWLSLLFGSIAVAASLPAPLREGVTQWRRGGYVALVLALAAIIGTNEQNAANVMERPYSGLSLSVLRWLADLDRDGYSALLASGDCNDFNSRVSPGATEQPGNGRDDNCALGDASPRAPLPAADSVPIPKTVSPMSVVFISADALSAAHMSLYGYQHRTTPNLEAWAAERGVVFENAQTCGAATAISFSSMFRGVYARRLDWARTARTRGGHFVRADAGREPELAAGDSVNMIYMLPTREPRPTLSWWLARRGMKTFGVTPVHYAEPASGVMGEFQSLSVLDKNFKDPDDEGATRQALAWLENLTSNDRFFLWIHYLGPHSPTTIHGGVPSFGKGLIAGYDNEVATLDRRVQPLLAELTRRQAGGEPIAVIFGADHGEEFGRDRYHAHTLSEAVTRVPFVISLPGVAPGRVSAPISTADLTPTILGLTETPIPQGLDGVDISELARDKLATGERIVISDAWVTLSDRLVTNKVAATDGKTRLVLDLTNQISTPAWVGSVNSQEPAPTLSEVAHLKRALAQYLEETAVTPF